MYRFAGLLYVAAFWWLLIKKPADYQSYIVGLSALVIVFAIEHVGHVLLDELYAATAPLRPRHPDR